MRHARNRIVKRSVRARGSRLTAIGAGAVALGVVAGACGGDVKEPANPGGATIVIGSTGWKEDVAVNTLWTSLLEDRGYQVKLTHTNPTASFEGLANDKLDIFLDAWLPNTHRPMMRDYGESLSKLGSWYNEATLEWTVPSYVQGVDSVADLRGRASMFDGTITGIGPDAGSTAISKNNVIPNYKLAGSYRVHESSGTAMLTALDHAIAAKEPIVVTLWHPHVAYTQYDLKDLEDPKGALGKGEKLWALSRQGFAADSPKVAEWIKNFQLSQEQLRQLEDLMFNQFPDNHQKAIDQWISNNQDLINKWIPEGSESGSGS